MTNQTKAAAAVLAAINNNTSEPFESVVGIAIEAAARALLNATTDKEKLVLHCFLMLSHELQGRPVSDVSREALAEDCPGLEPVETREALNERAWQGIKPDQILPGIQRLAEAVTGDH